MSAQIVPVTSDPNQSLRIALAVDGNTLTLAFAFRFNEIAQYWTMTISDATGNLLRDSVPLVTGSYPAGNLLAQDGHLAIGSAFLLNVSGSPEDYADSTNLGSDFLLVWDDTAT